jgi:hypothetical protein
MIKKFTQRIFLFLIAAFSFYLLPAQADVKALNYKNKIELQWSTAAEQNSSHFLIEKSSDGSNFSAIAHVTAAGSSNKRSEYTFIDRSPYDGLNFYRLQLVNTDQQVIQSGLVNIRYQPLGLINTIINPVREGLFLKLTSIVFSHSDQWRLYDLHGRVVAGERITGSVIYGTLPYIPAGVYVLELKVKDQCEHTTIIKQ